jgi:hypothetical protein
MPIAQELTIRMENRPGSLGKVCRELAKSDVNIAAFQSIPSKDTILVCIVVDKPETAKTVLDREGITFTEVEVAEARLQYGPGELARAALTLGEANININYAYSGVEPSTRAPLAIFGVTDVGRAATILDHALTTAAGA